MLKILLHRPIAVTMALIAIVVLGVLALGKIPVSLMPDIDIPRITVQMSSPGSSAREIEQNMVTPMRQQLAQVAGLKDIESSSRMDGGTITLYFTPGNDMSLLFIDVNEKIDRAMNSMPKDMERPKVMKMGALDIPAFYIDITAHTEQHGKGLQARDGGKDAAGNVPMHELSRLVKNVVSKRIEQLPEVAMVDMSGTVGTRIVIVPDDDKMEALGFTNQDVETAISNNNIILEALSIRDGIYHYSVHFDSQILTVADIENIYLRREGRLVQMKDLCAVSEVPAPRSGMVKSNGKDAVTLAVIKQNDAQMSDLQESIASLIKDMKTDYPDLRFEVTRDQTRLLSYSMENLEWNLVLGTLMACFVLFLFLGGWKMPLMVIISIPLSLILTLLCFYLIGISMNIISLSGLILGMGMIVDNAIIVIDNIRQRGMCVDTNVVAAVKEVFMPMLSSVLTTCSVFVPLIFLNGTAGSLFYDQAMGVAIDLFASLFVASAVVPVYYYALFKRTKRQAGGDQQNHCADESGVSARINRWMMGSYERVLSWCFRHQKSVLAGCAACVLLIVAMSPHIRKERMPAIEHDDMLMYVDWNAGITAEENVSRMNDMMAAVAPSLQASTVMAGVQDFMLPHTRDLTGSEAVCYMKAHTDVALDSVKQALAAYVEKRYPDAKVEYGIAAGVFDMIFSTGMPDLEVRLCLKDGGRPSVDEARVVTDMLRKEYPHLGIQPVATEANVRYVADLDKMAYYKVTYQQIYDVLKRLLSSSRIYDISSGGESVPVVVSSRPAYALGMSSSNADESMRLLMHTITNADGVDVPLMYLLTPSKGTDYKRLSAGGEGEYVPVKVEHASAGEVEDIVGRMKVVEEASGKALESPLKVMYAGDYFESREMIWEMAAILLVAVLLLYFILAAQFESLVQPGIILAEVAIDACAVMGVLFVTRESLNIMSMIGLIVMSGIIINDSILKVDTINNLRRGGMPILTAIVAAGHKRLKPIVMTSLTTILAIVPFLHRGDMGSALQYPLSLTLIVGMIVGTMVSLFVVPLMYYIIYRKK